LKGKQKYRRKHFKFLDYSSNEMKKNSEKVKNYFTYFLKGDQFAHQKINEKNTFLALTYSKIKIFSKF
jgi:hypothetical protein